MKIHPIISIVLGIVITFIFLSSAQAIVTYNVFNLSSQSFLYPTLLIFGILFGGFIATYFAKIKKIRYGSYEGVILGIITSIISYSGTLYVPGIQFDIFQGIAIIIIFALISSIGGYIGKSWNKPIQKITGA